MDLSILSCKLRIAMLRSKQESVRIRGEIIVLSEDCHKRPLAFFAMTTGIYKMNRFGKRINPNQICKIWKVCSFNLTKEAQGFYFCAAKFKARRRWWFVQQKVHGQTKGHFAFFFAQQKEWPCAGEAQIGPRWPSAIEIESTGTKYDFFAMT